MVQKVVIPIPLGGWPTRMSAAVQEDRPTTAALIVGWASPPASATSTLTPVVVSAISLADGVHLRLPLSSEGGGSVPKRLGF